MLTIVPIQPHQIADAKAVISGVAQRIYELDKSPEEFLEIHEHALDDVDNVQEERAPFDKLRAPFRDEARVPAALRSGNLPKSRNPIKRVFQAVGDCFVWLRPPRNDIVSLVGDDN